MKMIKDAKLTIIGSGPLKDKIISQINNFQLNDRINILPEVDEETLHNYYKNCDLLILPSVEKSETYGIVQIEGMACGKPIICTEIGTGTTYINEHNITGLVVPPRNSKALAEAINSLISNDKLRLELGANGKKKAFKEFTSAKMVQRTFELYKEVLNN
jgi:rhamnosyl/mannosyltransferase